MKHPLTSALALSPLTALAFFKDLDMDGAIDAGEVIRFKLLSPPLPAK